jgi:hypothetical protein
VLEHRLGLHLGQHVETAHPGHVDVEQHHVGTLAQQRRDGGGGIRGRREAPETGILEERFGKLDHQRLVVDHHHEGVTQLAERDVASCASRLGAPRRSAHRGAMMRAQAAAEVSSGATTRRAMSLTWFRS